MEATEAPTLDVRVPSLTDVAEPAGSVRPDGSRVPRLVRVRYGTAGGGVSGESATVDVPLPILGPESGVEEWPAVGPSVDGRRGGGLELVTDGRLLCGWITRSEADSPALETATLEAFRRILSATAAEGYPELLRVWACVPRINEQEVAGGERLERYKSFCRARAAAFEESWGRGFTRRLPASTAVGSEGGPLVVHFLAVREAGVHVENPCQVAAYRYPQCYGPRSPSFARGTVVPEALGGALFVSGTASIVGHASVHPGSLPDQTRETVRNLERVRAAAEGAVAGRGFDWSLFKVYLRRAEDGAEARRLLEELTGGTVPTLYLRADVCRSELLIEIEAVARPAGR